MPVVSTPPTDPKDILDLDDLRARAGGDEDLVHELLGDFLARTGEMSAVVETAAAGDFATTSRLAHRLKGSLLALGAKAAARSAADVEHQGAALAAAADADGRERFDGTLRSFQARFEQACLSMQAALPSVNEMTPARMSSGWR